MAGEIPPASLPGAGSCWQPLCVGLGEVPVRCWCGCCAAGCGQSPVMLGETEAAGGE